MTSAQKERSSSFKDKWYQIEVMPHIACWQEEAYETKKAIQDKEKDIHPEIEMAWNT